MRYSLNPQLRLPLVGAVGVAIGAAAGWTGSYFRSKKTIVQLLEVIEGYEEMGTKHTELREKLQEATDAMRERSNKLDAVADLIRAHGGEEVPQAVVDEHPSAEAWTPKALELTLVEPMVEEEKMVEVTPAIRKLLNIFPDADERPGEWDQEAEDEARQRLPGRPYIISVEEFGRNDFGFVQQTVTFYEGDDVLVDSHDVPIYDPGAVVGPLVFGKGSGDPNICYVRNKRVKTEYEVIRDTGSFEIEVQGLQIEQGYEETDLKHSAVRRMRSED